MKKRIYTAPEMSTLELATESLMNNVSGGAPAEQFDNFGEETMVREQAWPQQRSVWDD